MGEKIDQDSLVNQSSEIIAKGDFNQFIPINIVLQEDNCKEDRFERDAPLLTEGLKNEPDNVRDIFNLAQTEKAKKNFNEAIRWFKSRIEKGGGGEEVWYSKMMIGEIYEELDFWDQALHWYLEAYQGHRDRAEPLQKISTHYRLKGQNELAYLFAKQGSLIPYPKDQMFVTESVYNYQFDEEISIAAFYIAASKNEGFESADRLALKKGIPQHIKEQSYKNLVFYAPTLPEADFKTLNLESQLNNESTHPLAINSSVDSPYDFSRFFESVSPINFEGGYLTVIHEKVKSSDQETNHIHRFVFLDNASNILKISRPFVFKQKGEEFCSTMTFDPSGNAVLIQMGLKDKESWICSIPLETIRSLLKPLP